MKLSRRFFSCIQPSTLLKTFSDLKTSEASGKFLKGRTVMTTCPIISFHPCMSLRIETFDPCPSPPSLYLLKFSAGSLPHPHIFVICSLHWRCRMFVGTWVSYARDYCFVTNTYLLNGTTSHTNAPSHMVVKQGIHYYQVSRKSSTFRRVNRSAVKLPLCCFTILFGHKTCCLIFSRAVQLRNQVIRRIWLNVKGYSDRTRHCVALVCAGKYEACKNVLSKSVQCYRLYYCQRGIPS